MNFTYSIKYEQNFNIYMYIRIVDCMVIFHMPRIIVRNTGRFAGSTSRSMRNGTCQIKLMLKIRLGCLGFNETEILKVIGTNGSKKETHQFCMFSEF